MHIVNPNDTLICPKCKSEVSFDAAFCPKCYLMFSSNGLTPILQPAKKQKFSLFKKIFTVLILTPPIACVTGLALEAIIPGCSCQQLDGSCVSCGPLNGLIHALKFLGLIYSFFSILLIPIYLIVK